MKKYLLLVCCFLVSALVNAETSLQPLPKATFLISRFFNGSSFFEELQSGFDKLVEQGYYKKISRIDYQGNANRLMVAFDQAIKDSNAIFMDYVADSDVEYFIKQAHSHNIPLVFLFTKPNERQLLDNANIFYITQDDVMSGVSQGLLLSHYLENHHEVDRNGDGIINLLNIAGSGYKAPDERERLVWQINTINSYPGNREYTVREIENYPADYRADKARDFILKLAADGELQNIEAIISQDDQMTFGIVNGLKQARVSNIPIIARTDSPELLQLIRSNKVIGTVASKTKDVSYYAGIMAYNYARQRALNMDIPYLVYRHSIEVPYEIITAETLSRQK